MKPNSLKGSTYCPHPDFAEQLAWNEEHVVPSVLFSAQCGFIAQFVHRKRWRQQTEFPYATPAMVQGEIKRQFHAGNAAQKTFSTSPVQQVRRRVRKPADVDSQRVSRGEFLQRVEVLFPTAREPYQFPFVRVLRKPVQDFRQLGGRHYVVFANQRPWFP